MKFLPLLLSLLLAITARADDLVPGAKRIVFLGDSITYAGGYVDIFAATMFTRDPQRDVEILNLGLPSETVSGLSEEGHAGGKFPRPVLSERLARVLAKTKPDFVFACYGMNDGIYMPPSEERLARFREGMEALHTAVEASGAKIVHLTPPVFDRVPLKDKVSLDGKGMPYGGYDEVITAEAKWLLDQRARGWKVIDIHTPLAAALAAHRNENPDFAFSKDGVHADAAGHLVIAEALLEGLGTKLTPEKFTIKLQDNQSKQAAPSVSDTQYFSPELMKLVHQQQVVLKDSWLTACGHLRPGMAAGLPLDQAEKKAADLRAQIRKLVAQP
jgi:lysophospholipase L1-like esterase